MLQESEKRILELLDERHLLTKGELARIATKENLDALDVVLSRLQGRGWVDKVENMGNYIVITKAGIRALKGE
ncbi:MAG: hypothetical protein HY520_02165 [Candidatus Aenigmarchaeota archaeon]|nr:hypothetical protein [Candidatus Aenigmarchaeota archaeon]